MFPCFPDGSSHLYPQVTQKDTPTYHRSVSADDKKTHTNHAHKHNHAHTSKSLFHHQIPSPPEPAPVSHLGSDLDKNHAFHSIASVDSAYISRDSAYNSRNSNKLHPLHSNRDSIISEIGSDMTSLHPQVSQARRSQSDRSPKRNDSNSNKHIPNNSSSLISKANSQRRPPVSPHPADPPAQMLPFRPRDTFAPRPHLTHDTPHRLTAPYNKSGSNNNNNSSLMRSFHGPTQQHVGPPLTSMSLERLGRQSNSRRSPVGAYTSSDRPYASSESSYIPGLTWEDDRTTTSGSYTINPDELRPEVDSYVIRDSVV